MRMITSPSRGMRSFRGTRSIHGRCILYMHNGVAGHSRTTVGPGLPANTCRVFYRRLHMLGSTGAPPFCVRSSVSMSRGVHLGCHCLSLHHPRVRHGLVLQRGMAGTVHSFFSDHSFLRVRAPVLAGSAPRNTHSCLIPSHMGTNAFCTLPRSPRVFGRVLVITNCRGCFRVIHYFHSRSLHTSHRPRFARLSLRVSFISRRSVCTLLRRVVTRMFGATLNGRVSLPVPHVA